MNVLIFDNARMDVLRAVLKKNEEIYSLTTVSLLEQLLRELSCRQYYYLFLYINQSNILDLVAAIAKLRHGGFFKNPFDKIYLVGFFSSHLNCLDEQKNFFADHLDYFLVYKNPIEILNCVQEIIGV
jgi:hypothetical protein